MVVGGDRDRFLRIGFSSAQRTSIGGPLNREAGYGNKILDLGQTNGDIGTNNGDGKVLNLDSAAEKYQQIVKITN